MNFLLLYRLFLRKFLFLLFLLTPTPVYLCSFAFNSALYSSFTTLDFQHYTFSLSSWEVPLWGTASLTVPCIPSSHPTLPPKTFAILQNTFSWNLCIAAVCELIHCFFHPGFSFSAPLCWVCLWLSKPILFNFPDGATKALNRTETQPSLVSLLTH